MNGIRGRWLKYVAKKKMCLHTDPCSCTWNYRKRCSSNISSTSSSTSTLIVTLTLTSITILISLSDLHRISTLLLLISDGQTKFGVLPPPAHAYFFWIWLHGFAMNYRKSLFIMHTSFWTLRLQCQCDRTSCLMTEESSQQFKRLEHFHHFFQSR